MRRILQGAPALSPSVSADWGVPLYVQSQGACNIKALAITGVDGNTWCYIMSPDELVHTCQGKQKLGRTKQRNVATSRLKTQSHGQPLGLVL